MGCEDQCFIPLENGDMNVSVLGMGFSGVDAIPTSKENAVVRQQMTSRGTCAVLQSVQHQAL